MTSVKSNTLSANFVGRLAIATAALIAASGSASADPVLPAGSTAGLAMGAPLPQGVYFINTATFLERSASVANPALAGAGGTPVIDAAVNIPMAVWSTPWTVLGARVEVMATVPYLAVGTAPNSGLGATGAGTSSWSRDFYNPAGMVGLAWDLGGGWSFSNFVGAFAPTSNFTSNYTGLGGNYTTFMESANLAYNQGSWSASANFFYSHSGTNGSNTAATLIALGAPNNIGIRTQPDTAQIDFAITNHINKWELGLVGYGSADLGNPSGTRLVAALGTGLGTPSGAFNAKQSQFALGGLVGYNFGPVITQFYVTRDIAETNYSGYDTRIWSRVIVPLWNPETPTPKRLVTK
ncbi:MAG: transporter [Afipia sp.]|nr:transporter [Afipia sp.]